MATFSLVKKQIFRFFIFKNKIRYLFQFIMQFFPTRNQNCIADKSIKTLL